MKAIKLGNKTTQMYLAAFVGLLVVIYLFKDDLVNFFISSSNTVRDKLPENLGGFTKVEEGTPIVEDVEFKEGNTGASIAELQALINEVILSSEDIDPIPILSTDGYFGPKTHATAVALFGEGELSINEVKAFIAANPESSALGSTEMQIGAQATKAQLGVNDDGTTSMSGELRELSGAGVAYKTLDQYKAASPNERTEDDARFTYYWELANTLGRAQAKKRTGSTVVAPSVNESHYTWYKEYGRRARIDQ